MIKLIGYLKFFKGWVFLEIDYYDYYIIVDFLEKIEKDWEI